MNDERWTLWIERRFIKLCGFGNLSWYHVKWSIQWLRWINPLQINDNWLLSISLSHEFFKWLHFFVKTIRPFFGIKFVFFCCFICRIHTHTNKEKLLDLFFKRTPNDLMSEISTMNAHFYLSLTTDHNKTNETITHTVIEMANWCISFGTHRCDHYPDRTEHSELIA